MRGMFHNFETIWGTQEVPIKPYSVITIVKNEAVDANVAITAEGCENAQLA
jgi:hypothetical protein